MNFSKTYTYELQKNHGFGNRIKTYFETYEFQIEERVLNFFIKIIAPLILRLDRI